MSTIQSFITNENLTRINSKTYTLSKYPIANTESIFVNGILKNYDSSDYVIKDNTITFNQDLLLTDTVIGNYMIETPASEGTNISSAISARRELIHWCLRKLGAPVIDINLDDDQIEDRIDEALRYFRDYHFDGVERCYFYHKVTTSTMKLQAAYTAELPAKTIIVGNSSKAQGRVYSKSEDNLTIFYKTTNGRYFIPGETVTIYDTVNTFQISSSPISISLGNLDTGYVDLGTKVLSITNIIPQESSTIGGNLGGMFDFQYQFALNNMFNLASTDLVTYDIYKRYISMWEFMFRGQKGIRFNRKTDRVYFDMNTVSPGQWVIFECWVALNPSIYQEIYSDEFVREYACSLLKMQWGSNLKKFSGITLPGGTTLNGQQIYDEAKAEIDVLRERVRKEFELPPDFLVG